MSSFALLIVAALVLFNLFFPVKYQSLVEGYSHDLGVDTTLVFAVINAESGFSEDAVSSAGAIGLMQIMPKTAEFCCELMGLEFEEGRLYEAEYNLRIGIFYLSYLLNRFSERAAVAAFNAGEGVVGEWIAEQGALFSIPYKETREYVERVFLRKEVYRFLGY